jgi:hypothetical protein
LIHASIHFQIQVVGPKRAKLAEAEITLASVMKALAAKQAELAAVEAKLSELGTQLDAARLKKANLEVGAAGTSTCFYIVLLVYIAQDRLDVETTISTLELHPSLQGCCLSCSTTWCAGLCPWTCSA